MFQNASAANDEIYFHHQNKNLPITATLTCVRGYPTKLKIYLISGSPYWQTRCFYNGKLHIRSTKTTNKRAALTFAQRFYEELCAIHSKYSTYKDDAKEHIKQSFSYFAEEALKTETIKSKRNECSAEAVKILRGRLYQQIIPYFRNKPIANIQYEEISAFLNQLEPNLSNLTLKQYIVALRKVFNQALNNGVIRNLPTFPKIRTQIKPRGSFTVDEYFKLLRTAKALCQIIDAPKKVTHRNSANGIFTAKESIPKEMVWLIGFMVNSFIRPADAKLIQHKHVEIVRGKNTYLRLTLPETKKHNAQIVTLQPAVRIYLSLKKYMAAKGLAKANDYLFLPEVANRRSAIILMSGFFNKCLTNLNLKHNHLEQNRTLYSLRHTAIMFRLLYGKNIDLLTLARNARTSVEMIERFYASNLTAEMNIDLLQSRR